MFFPAWKENESYKNFIVIFGNAQGIYYLAAVNCADTQSQCYAYFDISAIAAEEIIFKDIVGSSEYIRNKEEIAIRGLYLEMSGYSFHLFKILAKE